MNDLIFYMALSLLTALSGVVINGVVNKKTSAAGARIARVVARLFIVFGFAAFLIISLVAA
jgi:hypothetical protein